MKNARGKILYIGKAKNLKVRIKQYFVPGRDGRMMIPFLTSQVANIDTIVVTSEKEALLLENTLIKKHQPKYNILLKDDKSFFSLMINHKHQWPMIKVARYKGRPPKGNLYFGPYTKSYAARETLNLLRTLFPLRQCSDQELKARTRPCILYEMKKCLAPCVKKCSKQEYDTLVEHVIEFLKGKDKTIIKKLQQEREAAMEALAFEKAEKIHRTLKFIAATLEKQKIEKAGRKDLDVIGFQRKQERVALTQMQYRDGKLVASHDYLASECAQADEAILTSFILQHYEGREELPSLLLLPFALAESELLGTILELKLLTPLRGDKHDLVEMANLNAKVHLNKEPEKDRTHVLMAMEEELKLTHFPERIECFDTSNISGSDPVSAMVVFTDGKKDPKSYRKYKVATSDDYAALREVLTRRFKQAEVLPDLILIDGGKGHLNTALKTLAALNISTVDVMGVAKEKGRHDKGITQERLFFQIGQSLYFSNSTPPSFFYCRRSVMRHTVLLSPFRRSDVKPATSPQS